MKLRIGDLLKEKGLINDQQFRVALAQQSITGGLLGEIILKLGFISSRNLAKVLAEQSGLEFLDLEGYTPSNEALRLISKDNADKIGLLPLEIRNGQLSIGITDPSNIFAIDAATRISGGKPPRVYVVGIDEFRNTLNIAYYFLENPIHERIAKIIEGSKQSVSVQPATISALTELLIMDGIRRSATDIHITPVADVVHVFYRIDGVLQHAYCLPKIVQTGITSKIKVLSQLDIAEQRLPQDGSFAFTFLHKQFNMRVSTLPTIHGENVVIRVLGLGGSLLRITELGFDPDDTLRLKRLFAKPFGMIIIAGPTGSGKTTTLYAALKEVNLLEKNVMTVEDPVEYRLSMVRQTSISEKVGYDFELAGRNFMRQDPDVMLIGEIRDEETAKIAIRSSITGHLVLTTLHANDAASTIPRLITLDVDKFLLSSSLLAVIAQRLVRKICHYCKIRYELRPGELKEMGIPELEGRVKVAYKGKGCPHCNHTGYLSRTVIGEIIIVNDKIRELIFAGASVRAIKDAAMASGTKTMRMNGLAKVVKGITTFEELLRVVG